MKRKLLVILFALVAAIACTCLYACKSSCGAKSIYELSLISDEEYFYLEIDEEVDYTQYFIIKDIDGNQLIVTRDMLDLSQADTSRAGTFSVTLTFRGQSITANFIVEPDEDTPAELKTVFANYKHSSSWNFGVHITEKEHGVTDKYYLEYLGQNICYKSTYNNGETFYEYWGYDRSSDTHSFYFVDSDGTCEKYEEDSQIYNQQYRQYYLRIFDLSQLNNYTFVKAGDGYEAKHPDKTGVAVFGERKYEFGSGDSYKWLSLTVFTDNENITKIVGVKEGELTVEYEFEKFGQVSFTLPTVGSDDGGDTSDWATIIAKYADMSKWNFATDVTLSDSYGPYDNYYYAYLGYNILNQIKDGTKYYNNYWSYDPSSYSYTLYLDKGDGTYEILGENDDDFYDYFAYLYIIDLSPLGSHTFTLKADGHYEANSPTEAGNAILGEFEDFSWSKVSVYVANGKITKVVGETEDGSSIEFELKNQGSINFTLPETGGSGDSGSGGGDTTPAEKTTVTVSIAKYATANKWIDGNTENAPCYTTIEADSNITITADSKGYNGYFNTGKYYSSSGQWRIYQNENATLTFTAATGINIVSVKITYLSQNTGVLTSANGANQYTSGKVISVDANSVTFKVGNTGTDKKGQLRITEIEVVYSGGSGSTGGNTSTSGTMEKQTYNPSTFDHGNLHDKMVAADDSVGLPSTGKYNALVVPVQFKGDTITQTQLNNLKIAFNSENSSETGWESVKSYYKKASYGKLDLTFDIQPVYQANKTASEYSSYQKSVSSSNGTYTQYGEEAILLEVLSYYENRLDLSDYDTNGDGCIDAVYLIYSAPVDYDKADFYWAYVTWYYGDNDYDGVTPYYYLFAGFDFMDESTSRDSGSGYDKIDGLKINASTYIHETGHLLGLDDYYDYETSKGSNQGLGGADMMDYTVGDQNVYSKIMLGWFEPTIVNSTQTLTIKSSQAEGSAILIPLNFNNSYFCEYLLIDLYSAQGLNALHASAPNSYLYGGASYGVRIYHVSSSINNPYQDDGYGSFTDNNNSVSNTALIKLVEADGETSKSTKNGGAWASQSDLWKAGSKLSSAFPSYKRNDGKKVNFDITINSVSATEASITITFN